MLNERTLSSKIEKSLSWKSYVDMIFKLEKLIRASGKKFDYIYGVPRGGFIPAVILSHSLNIPIISNFLDGKDGTVLIVDDLVDTGKTVIDLIAMRKNMDVFVATLFKHKKCKVFPDIYVKQNSGWIQFPYEKENAG
nr:phosphoribosyltransferase [Candidatus Omnitrophota bacterium]